MNETPCPCNSTPCSPGSPCYSGPYPVPTPPTCPCGQVPPQPTCPPPPPPCPGTPIAPPPPPCGSCPAPTPPCPGVPIPPPPCGCPGITAPTAPVPPLSGTADVSISKIAESATVSVGGTLTYNITITNAGPDTAQNVQLTDVLPAGLSNSQYLVAPSGAWVPWTGTYLIPSLTPGASVTLYLSSLVGSATSPIQNTATISSGTNDPNTANNASSVSTPIV